MLKRFTVGSVFGIELDIDITLLIALPLFAGLIATQVGELTTLLSDVFGLTFGPGLRAGVVPWVLGFVAAIGLFLSVALHEFGHASVSRTLGYDIDSITLWILGGVADLADDPSTWWHEVAIALAGPAVSVGIAAVVYGVLSALAAGGAVGSAAFVVAYVGLLNAVLAGFNLLPGFPMDGGRVLRGLLARNRSMADATVLAARVGQFVAFLLGIVGILTLNLLLLGIAFFVYIGAGAETARARFESIFGDQTVAETMTPASDVESVSPDATVADLYDRMYATHHTGYPVVDEGELVGIVTLGDVADVSEADASRTSIRAVMSTSVVSVAPETTVFDAFETMQSEGVDRLPVVEAGELVGIVTQTDLVRVIRIAKTQGTTDGAGPGSPDVQRLPLT